MDEEAMLEILNGAFDVVRVGEDGPHLAVNTLYALGLKK